MTKNVRFEMVMSPQERIALDDIVSRDSRQLGRRVTRGEVIRRLIIQRWETECKAQNGHNGESNAQD